MFLLKKLDTTVLDYAPLLTLPIQRGNSHQRGNDEVLHSKLLALVVLRLSSPVQKVSNVLRKKKEREPKDVESDVSKNFLFFLPLPFARYWLQCRQDTQSCYFEAPESWQLRHQESKDCSTKALSPEKKRKQ